MKYIKTLFLISVFILMSETVLANDTDGRWGIGYNLVPKNPEPGDFVNLYINSYSSNLDASNISYYVNGKFMNGGTGEKELFFKMPDSYKPVKIKVFSEEFNGKSDSKEIIIRPASVDLVYEVVDPFRPLFYKGKSAAVSQSKLKFFAFPNFYSNSGKLIDKKTIIYTWKVNEKVMFKGSGYGKDSFELRRILPYPKKTIVEVEAKSLDETIMAIRSIVINPIYPKIDFYIDNGIFPVKFKDIAQSNTLFANSMDTTVIGIPYFMSNLDKAEVGWKINQTKINMIYGADVTRMEILRNKQNIFNSVKVKMSIENEERILQSAYRTLYIRSTDKLMSQYKAEIDLNKFESNFNQKPSPDWNSGL